ncbi:unnamed protein product [Rangifer tarandus platyrhynchus]|uniref:Uncharacterized protein n=1 Tax=Rangifer tarandus platyrhynchus TaxID=3082113 RepID=A0ABN8ZEH8_RANTA|nr:unnamed protein product [Rangifer tarandus platyrhynchus]
MGQERCARSVTTSEPGNNEVSQHPDTALASRPAGLADKQLGGEADAHSLGSYCGPGLCQDSGLGDLPQGRFLFGRRSVTPESSLPRLCPACKRDQTGLWPRVRDPTLLGPWELRSQASPGTHRRWLGTAVIRGPEGSLPSHSSTQEEGALPPASHLHPVGEGSLLGGERGVETAAFLNRPALVSIPAL